MRNFFFINLCALFVLLTVQESFAGSLTDLRDGKTYKTVTILGQEWMAENLNLEYNVGTAKSGCLMVKGNFPGCNFSPPEGSTMVYAPKVGTCPEEMIFTVCFRS